jgi:peptidoglycan/LPS O-acetylase OafA/YrhL
MNPSTKNIPYLDGWRGVAIVCLLVGHFFPVPGINLGEVGVDLFFVLSGLLMARLLFVTEVPIALFYKRRASRVFPAMYFFLVAVVVAFFALGRTVDWAELASAAIFLKNYFPGKPNGAVMPFGHIWSLCVEEHSYIVLSLVAIGARARLFSAKWTVGLLTILLAAVGIGYWLSYSGDHLALDRWIHSEVSAFGIFASAFLLMYFGGRPMPRLPFMVLPVIVGFGLAMHWWSVPAPLQTILGVGALALAVNLLKDAPITIHRILSVKPLRQFGVWSFSIYLWQQPFYYYVNGEGMAPWMGLGLAIITGIASFYWIENPVRAYLNRAWARPAAQADQAGENTLDQNPGLNPGSIPGGQGQA